MNKGELIERVQATLGEGTSKKDAGLAVDAVLEVIADGIRENNGVHLVGFGSFKVTERAARMGHNPSTRKPMRIEASKSVRFAPSAVLKSSLQSEIQ